MYRSVVKQRLFLGWPPGDAARDHLAARVAEYRRLPGLAPVRWLEPEGWHLTLRFIGETDRGNELAAALEPLLADQPPTRLRFANLGPFPPGRPAVLAFKGPLDASLEALSARIETAVDSVGLAPQRRSLKPHLSIARVKYWHAGPWPDLDTPIDLLIDRVAVYRSETQPQGARYVILREWSLGGTSIPG